jgi:DNA-binding Lrp family transcriptional regulator
MSALEFTMWNMARPATRKAELREFILAQVLEHPTNIAAVAMERFKLSRQWVTRVLAELVEEGVLTRTGATRDVRYVPVDREVHQFKVTPGLNEHDLWDRFAKPALSTLPANVFDICHYGFTEMVNNVIDHSESETGFVGMVRGADRIGLSVVDPGVGIFAKIKRVLGLDSLSEAIFELSKGKFTTDPAHHTGEGVFFTSRVFDQFSISSSGMLFLHHRDSDDWLLDNTAQTSPGTSILMSISRASTHTLEDVFDQYATEREGYAFNRTRLVLKLAEHADGPLMSRSQAKRVTTRLHRFKEVVLDFAGVESIGPSFADEIFRVYQRAHPAIELIPINTNERTGKMVTRALTASREDATEDPAS